ncbi:pyridoxal phosphate-dependent transferase [Sphaerosporella brunnea]|uniref:Glutamate decarboxylase n=1 Tax=Sphaerosporella brunnea TaxID=1250544 RepID=A0A5J5ER35_9PEZI|nr:pyridoxal phosphate-dependent transferase [Sphaerosporella brunnea]
MSLSKHIDPDELIASLRENAPKHQPLRDTAATHHVYSGRYAASAEIPKFRLPDSGSDSHTIYQLIKDELDLDGRPNLNLASFVNTFMDPYADRLMAENVGKNMADADEYPVVQAIHARCISMLGNLWNVPKGETAIGAATTGSSEAIHLGGLAMKRLWQQKRREQGKSTEKPNIIMGANAQVALEKFARYFEVEARILPVSEESHYCLDVTKLRENIDENTIGVFAILGSTYTGHYEPVEEISKVLDEFEKETGHSIPIHIDGASGAMVVPFTGCCDGLWDFRLPRVHSISTSGHKFGLVYAGLGWAIWRNEKWLPKDLIFELHYLGGTEQTFTLNFSRPCAQVIAQYFNFLSLGKEGYVSIMHNALTNARMLSKALEASGWYTCVSDIHRKRGSWGYEAQRRLGQINENDAKLYNPGLPVVAFRFNDEFRKEYPHVKQASVSTLLRVKGYIIPNYNLPPNTSSIEILRVVVRESMSADLLDMLISDILSTTETLMKSDIVDIEALGNTSGSWADRGRKLVDAYVHPHDKDGLDLKSDSAESSESNLWRKWRTKGVFSTTC